MNGRRKLVLANRRNSVKVNCVAQSRRMSRTMLPCRRSYTILGMSLMSGFVIFRLNSFVRTWAWLTSTMCWYICELLRSLVTMELAGGWGTVFRYILWVWCWEVRCWDWLNFWFVCITYITQLSHRHRV